jgi:tRNA U34 5-carboxymethylaminomethyl modifying GTPase MnmE/TrmE
MLSRAIDAIDRGVSADIYCTDAEEALGAYLALEGRDVGEAVVAEIFSSFCVGK